MSHSPLRRALHPVFPIRDVQRQNSTLQKPKDGYIWLRRVWAPQRASGISRRVVGDVNVPCLQNRSRRKVRDLLGLLHGLGMAKCVRAVVPGKVDLSHFDPLSPPWLNRDKANVLIRPWAGLSRKGIVECFLFFFFYKRRLIGPLGPLPPAEMLKSSIVWRVFDPKALAYLEKMKCKPEDVMAWAWILMTKDGTVAGLRLDAWAKAELARIEEEANRRGETEKIKRLAEEWKKRVEEWKRREEEDRWSWNRTFNLFRKQEPDADEKVDDSIITTDPTDLTPTPDIPLSPMVHRIPPFLLLFILRFPNLPSKTLRLLLPYITAALERSPFLSNDTKTPLLLLIRLLRQARVTYPSAIPHIATLLTTHLHPSTHPPRPSARLTALYNRLLTLFSLPSHNRPFKVLPLHQRSQFLILRKMASLNIPLTREGYRALTSVQLGHRKTPAEAAHIRGMSPSWPPWPLPRDGHPLTPPPHLSRAAQVLQQMASAGYPARGWESVALVLAGTDTDRSPTIQTRTLLPVSTSDPKVWAARVRATRTAEEAWAVFTAALDSHVSAQTWIEMFAKLIAARKARGAIDRRRRALEKVRAACSSGEVPAEAVKVARRWELGVKDEAEHAQRVVAGEGKEVLIFPPGTGVYISSPVPSVEELFQLMQRVGKTELDERIVAMLVWEAENIAGGDWILRQWSKTRWERLKATTNSLSTTTPHCHYHISPTILTSYLHLLFKQTRTTSSDHTDTAVQLLLAHKPRYPPAWNQVLAGLTTPTSHPRAALIWHVYQHMRVVIHPDIETLRILCIAAERTPPGILWDNCEPVNQIISIFTREFEITTPPQPPPQPPPPPPPPPLPTTTASPRLLEPEPAALHAYVRVLGFAGRHKHIVELMRWMKEGTVEVETVMARRVLVAARLFLQDGEMAAEARAVLEAWEGAEWPREEEVEEYCIRGGMC